jgi:hypothetical protein
MNLIKTTYKWIKMTYRKIRRWYRRRFLGLFETVKPSGTISLISKTSPGLYATYQRWDHIER